MDSDYSKVGLYDHNIIVYEKIDEGFEHDNTVAIVQATGTGKTYNALQFALDNKNKKIIYVAPSNGIIEHINEIIDNNPNLDMERDFPNIEFRTYQSFINMSKEELENLDIDVLILDEFHHLGAPVWGPIIDIIIKSHPNITILGMTAYTIRDRGTSYERDMVNPDTNEVFSGKVVSSYDLCDAMIDGVLPKPIYKSAYVKLIPLENKLSEKIKDSKDYNELEKLLSSVRKRIHEAPSIADVVKKFIKRDGKYIYFCPPFSEKGVNDIETIKQEIKQWFLEMGLTEDDFIIYQTTSDMGNEGKRNRKAFYNDVDINGKDVKNKLRVMLAINQYNEGVHVPNIDGVILGRETTSDIVFFEQVGRALAVRGKTKEKFEEYEKYSKEQLIQMCKEKDINCNEEDSKEEIIEKLLSPVIIDLTNNIEFIKELETNLKDRIKEIQNDKTDNKRVIKIQDASFDIEIENQDLYEILKYVMDRLTRTWEDIYEYVRKYYEYHKDLEIPLNFKTNDGYTYDENGIALGQWIHTQRTMYKKNKLSEDRIKMLEQIGMRFDTADLEALWMKNYNLAKAYYEKNGNLDIPQKFKTTNGYDYDENGIAIGRWLSKQRISYKAKKMSSDRVQMFEQIGMQFDKPDFETLWMKNYNLAKAYYEKNGNLEIPQRFKTINGYDYDEKGIAIGDWVGNQRKMYASSRLKEDRIKMLEQIGMRFDTADFEDLWMQKYKLAKAYYEKNGNLDMPWLFKTKNGYDYDENGTNLWHWINTLRQAYNGKNECKLNERRIKLLEQIGMRFDTIDVENLWMQKYKLAKAYYDKYGNLDIPQKFKTTNGYDYDEKGIPIGRWISKQKVRYKAKKMSSDRIQMLEQIGMCFDTADLEALWMKNYNLAKIYYEKNGNLEIPQRFKTINGYDYDEKGIALGSWIYNQKKAYKGQMVSRLTDIKIKLLEDIHIIWFSPSLDLKFQSEIITEKNSLQKRIEILNRFKTYLNSLGSLELVDRKEFNNGFIKQLNKNMKNN